MSDSKQADHWDQLASVLGAEPQKKEPGEPISQVEEQKTETTEDIIINDIIEDIIKDADAKTSVAEPPGEPAPASSAPTLSSWDALAMELGIEVKPEPPRAPAPMQAPVSKQTEKKTDFRAERPQESSRTTAADFGKHIESFRDTEPFSAGEPREKSEKKPRRRRRHHRKDRDKDHPGAEMKKTAFEPQRDAPLMDDISLPEASPETADKSDAGIKEGTKEEEAGKQHLKHRRSRRGSRKRRKKATEGDREIATDANRAASAGHDELAASSETTREFAGEEENEVEELEDRGQRGARSDFRAIPTWEQAVGCIITKNMDARPRRQGDGPPRSRSGAESHKRRRK